MIETATLERAKINEIIEERKRKCVILLSGGIDSTVLMYSLVADYEVWPLTISYGQRHNKEVVAARNVCGARTKPLLYRWKHVDLSVLRTLLPSALTGVGEIPEGYYADESMKATVVPNRNMILLAVASGYAQGIGARHVAYAPHVGDHPIYPDCREVYIQAARQTIRLGTGWNEDGVELHAPFSKMTKADIVRFGKELNVPFRLCWSCYRGEDRPCLQCGTCVERTLAFEGAGFADPALTPEEWFKALKYAKEVS